MRFLEISLEPYIILSQLLLDIFINNLDIKLLENGVILLIAYLTLNGSFCFSVKNSVCIRLSQKTFV